MKIIVGDIEYILLKDCPLRSTTETLAFKTDVHESIVGTEQRIPLLDNPRQSFNYSMLAYREQVASIFTEFYQGLRSLFLIPQPLEVLSVSCDSDFISCDTELLSISVGSLVLIGGDVVEVVSIGVIDSETGEKIDGYRINTSISVENKPLKPLRRCIIDGNMTAEMNRFVFTPQVFFRVLDAIQYEADKSENCPFCTLLTNNYLQVEFTQQQAIVDGELGNFYSFTDWSKSKKKFNMRVLMRNVNEYLAFKKWFFGRRGRLNSFKHKMYEGGSASVLRAYRLDSDQVEFRFTAGQMVETVLPVVEVH